MSSCLLIHPGLWLSMKTMMIYEGQGVGAQWSTIATPPGPEANLSLLDVIGMLCLDIFLCGIVTWYVDNVRPGEFGVPQPYHFPLTKKYWMGGENRVVNQMPLRTWTGVDASCFEKEPNLTMGIAIDNIRKEFKGSTSGDTTVAVAGMTLNIYEGQITALLGHNGAGKTTTMSMLTGFIPPTSGTAKIYGSDIITDIADVRNSLAFCPQHDILFDKLTVGEHLRFYLQLKGATRKDVTNQENAMLQMTGLAEKRNELSSGLSGGQKRKLSVGIALCGGSKVIVLDEPSSGIDPQGRRELWDILVKHKPGRTILLSTHFMDEADVLGDRIAIMTSGVLKCCGSSLFLKHKYSAGYHLVIVKDRDFKEAKVTALIREHVPHAKLLSSPSHDMTFILPIEDKSRFKNLFATLEEGKSTLNISSFGISETTMDDVFLKVGENVEEKITDDTQTLIPQYSQPRPEHTQTRPPQHFQPRPEHTQTHLPQPFQAPAEHTQTQSPVPNPPLHTTQPVPENVTNDYGKLDAPSQNISTLPTPMVSDQYQNNSALDTHDAPITLQHIKFNENLHKKTGMGLRFLQCKALFIKRIIYMLRNWLTSLAKITVPVLYVLLSMSLFSISYDELSLNTPLQLTLDKLGPSYVPLYTGVDEIPKAFSTAYKKQISSTKATLVPGSTTDFVLEYFKKKESVGIYKYFTSHFIGAEFGYDITEDVPYMIGFYNGEMNHMRPISLAYLLNAMNKVYVDENTSIQTTIHPLPKLTRPGGEKKVARSTTQNIKKRLSDQNSVSGNILSAMGMVSGLYAISILKERLAGVKHMQITCGVPVWMYWGTIFLFDISTYIIPCAALIGVLEYFEFDPFIGDRRGLFFLILLLSGWSYLSFVYAIQFIFTTTVGGAIGIIIIFGLSNILFSIVGSFFYLIPIPIVYKIYNWILVFVSPPYCLSMCLKQFVKNYNLLMACRYVTPIVCKILEHPCCPSNCGKSCLPVQKNYLSFYSSGVGIHVLALALQGLVYMAVTMVIDLSLLNRVRVQRTSNPDQPIQDSDVKAEADRVALMDNNLLENNTLVVDRLYRRFLRFIAVDHISVAVPKGECFGLLGVNGAGKTTTFRMLTADLVMTGGQAFITKNTILDLKTRAIGDMGYCPQYNALIDQFTCREMLYLFARLRGVSSGDVPRIVDIIERELLLVEHANKRTSALSGGNKRKLCTAMALIGDPAVLFLDEPTTGMDPAARHKVWDVLSDIRRSGRTIIFTSHNMEECDAICTRIGIMVNGQFQCLGSPQQLKSKFGKGYTLTIRVTCPPGFPEPDLQYVLALIDRKFPSNRMLSSASGAIVCTLTESVAEIFGVMEESVTPYQIEDYSVSQSTLDHIFIEFAKCQKPEQKIPSRWFAPCRCSNE